ncbi:CatB-related O-acetyltransferase [Aliivibrio logei]|uniref:Acetyltransferase n=1 Tax=Aliivibrio logei 5S-186 TaxID=626086 RepID=A0ABX3ARJ3_ALILO|nr:CatB-related O-acetyltransferase [Aliivibrio logei]OEF09493.1 hypothetical protein A1Q5_14550 [Aliivibrio logei 5S-186]
MDNYKLTKLQIRLIDWIGPYLIRKKQKKIQFNLIKELIYVFLVKFAYTLPYGRFTEGERYISQRFFGFSVGQYSYRYQQFWKQDNLIESIGAYCSFAINITVVGGNHPINFVTTHPITINKKYGFVDKNDDESISTLSKKIIIGNDVWIGANVTLLPGITIGDGAVIGAGSVVTKDIEPYSIVAGVPARLLRYRFTQQQIKELINIEWWNWPDDRVKSTLSEMKNIDSFIAKHRVNV